MDKLHPFLKLFPDAKLKAFNTKQRSTISGYASISKLRGVMKWRPRMVAAGITVGDLAEKLEKAQPRISEWLNFTHEPEEENYLAVEAKIYELEKPAKA